VGQGSDVDDDPASDAPTVRSIPVGLVDAAGAPLTGERQESDSMGAVAVPADRYWGAQTQRSLHHFAISSRSDAVVDRMPVEVPRAMARIKQAAAAVNVSEGLLPAWKGELISRVAGEVVEGLLDEHFPLSVWQTGSGTQTNMNVNEVVANRCIQLVGGELGARSPVHPNDDVNMGQSSNDTFPTAMHLAAHEAVSRRCRPSLAGLRDALDRKSRQWADVVKIGRTHLQDATPMTVGQEWSGFVGALDDALDDVDLALDGLLPLAVGGTAVGTGLNAPPGFGAAVADELAQRTGVAWTSSSNPFTALSTIGPMVRLHAALRQVAIVLFKVADDLRWLASGPRAGLGELQLPANEPGSSIMPGKVNPTQCEAMQMVCAQVMGHDVAVGTAGAVGNLQLNTLRPMVIADVLASAHLLGDAATSFRVHLVEGTELRRDRVDGHVARSAMLVTALSPEIGYDRAAAIAHHAVEHDLELREAAIALGVAPELFDRIVDPAAMTGPDRD
jgi:fumarate hydratase, class II